VRRNPIFALLLALTLVAAACGGGDDDDAAGVGGEETEATSEASEDELDPNGSLTYGAANLPSRLDPHRSSNGFDQNWLAPVYERLIDQTPDAELIPGLATEWEFVDQLTFEMKLREGVTFHDGTPFNAEAVKINIERAKNDPESGLFAYLEPVATVEVVDDLTVRFILSKPDSTLPNQLATRPGMMASPAAIATDNLDTEMVGTGMFTFVEYRDGDRAIFERNEDYWGEPAKLQRLELVYMVDPTTRANALVSGQVDAAPIDPNDVAQVEGAGFDVQFGEGVTLWHLFVNRTLSEFGDVRVRQAMEHAVDHQALVDLLIQGYGKPSQQWVPEGTPYWNEDYAFPHYEYDPERARELLAEAGLPDGFSFELLVPNSASFVRLAEILQQQYAEVGIDVTLRQIDASESSDIFFVRKEGQVLLAAAPGRVDPAELVQIYFNPTSFSNPGGHTTPEIMEAWQAALEAFEEPELTETRIRLSGLITEQALNPVFFFPQQPLAATEEVTGLEWYLSGHIEFENVGVRAG
jgi:peptide/nickel transport system substrate-binding protein